MKSFLTYLVIISTLVQCFGISLEKGNNYIRDELYRPKLHYSVPENWSNDPNGMFYLNGLYHLYYQYTPGSTNPGLKSWAHVASKDGVQWIEYPVAIAPDEELGDIWSGSSVVDFTNSSGFQTNADTPVVIAMYTQVSGRQQQSIAYSNDEGTTFTKYAGNPVISNTDRNDFRDPKVVRYQDHWVMVLAVGNKVEFYSSEDLKAWTFLSEFGSNQGSHDGVWECPDFLEITYNDFNTWVLLVSISGGSPNGGSGTQYFIGEWDGKNFISAQVDPLWLEYGTDNYAGVTYFNEPNGKKILIGWMSNLAYAGNTPTIGWRGQMTLPRELDLRTIGGQLGLDSKFAEGLRNLEIDGQLMSVVPRILSPDEVFSVNSEMTWSNSLFRLNLVFDITTLSSAASISVCFLNNLEQEICVGYDHWKTERSIFVDRARSGNIGFSNQHRPTANRLTLSNEISFEIILDTSAIEIIVDSGLVAMTSLFYPDEPFTQIEIRHHANGALESELNLVSGSVQGLKPFN